MGEKDIEKVSIIIATHNRKNELIECLNSLKKQTYPNYEIVIIDNNSTDGTRELILNEYPETRLFCNKNNLSLCKPRNFGVAKSLGSYLWFLDSDSTIVNNNCLSVIMKLMKSDETIGSIGGTVYLFDDQSTKIVLPQDNRFNIFDDWDREYFQLIECDYLPGSNLLMKKEVLLKIGGFTEIYDIYWEDRELGLKIIKLGLRNITDRRTIVLHPFKFGSSNLKKAYLFYRNAFLYVFFNLGYNKGYELLVGKLQQRDPAFKGKIENTVVVKNHRLADKLILLCGFLLGFAGIVCLFLPIIKIKWGTRDYIRKYVSNEEKIEI